MRAVCDSGATQNWVSRQFVESIGAKPSGLGQAVAYDDFQGGTFTADSSVELRWQGNKSNIMRVGPFLIAENGPFDVVIGKDHLFSKEVFRVNEAALMNKQKDMDTSGPHCRWTCALVVQLT